MAAKEKWQLFKLEKLLFMAFGSLDQCSTSAMSFIPLKGILRSKTSLFCSLEGSLVFENDLPLVQSIFFHFSALDLKYFCWCDSSNDQFPYRVARVLMDEYTQSGPVFLLLRPYKLHVHDHRCHLVDISVWTFMLDEGFGFNFHGGWRFSILHWLAAPPSHHMFFSLMSFYKLNFVQKGPLMGELVLY